MKPKRGRSGIEMVGVVVFMAARTIPVLWVLAGFILGMLCGSVWADAEPLRRWVW